MDEATFGSVLSECGLDFVRVGYRDYSIEVWPSIVASSKDVLGECDKTLAVIRLRGDLDPWHGVEVLLHEIFHAAWEEGCAEGGDEEKIVSIFGKVMTQVWRDNPDLRRFLLTMGYADVPDDGGD